MFRIIDKINKKTFYFNNEIEQGFFLDEYLESNKEFLYNWVNYKIEHKNNDILIIEI